MRQYIFTTWITVAAFIGTSIICPTIISAQTSAPVSGMGLPPESEPEYGEWLKNYESARDEKTFPPNTLSTDLISRIKSNRAVSDKSCMALINILVAHDLQNGIESQEFGKSALLLINQLNKLMPDRKELLAHLTMTEFSILAWRDEPPPIQHINEALSILDPAKVDDAKMVCNFINAKARYLLDTGKRDESRLLFKKAMDENPWMDVSDYYDANILADYYVSSVLGYIDSCQGNIQRLKAINYAPAFSGRIKPYLSNALEEALPTTRR